MNNDFDWDKEAASILKAAIVKRGLTHEEVCQRLAEIGVKKTPNSLGLSINRGRFTFAFFLQCARVLGITKIYLDE